MSSRRWQAGVWGVGCLLACLVGSSGAAAQSTGEFGLPGIVHVADRIAHHPETSDPRAPELFLNFEYLEKHRRGGKWNEWREACAAAISSANPAQGKPS